MLNKINILSVLAPEGLPEHLLALGSSVLLRPEEERVQSTGPACTAGGICCKYQEKNMKREKVLNSSGILSDLKVSQVFFFFFFLFLPLVYSTTV